MTPASKINSGWKNLIYTGQGGDYFSFADNEVSYSFILPAVVNPLIIGSDSLDVEYNAGLLSEQSVAEFRKGLNIIEYFVDLDFLELNSANVDLYVYKIRGIGASGGMIGRATSAGKTELGDLQIDYSEIGINENLIDGIYTLGTENFEGLIHEILHSIGLGHTDLGTNEGIPQQSVINQAYANTEYSIMSYSYFNSNGSNIHTYTPQQIDIYALEELYGLNTTSGTSNGFYGDINALSNYSDLQHEDFMVIDLDNKLQSFTIHDNGGDDVFDVSTISNISSSTLDFSADSRAIALDANGNKLFSIYITEYSHIEEIISGNGNDIITGGDETDNVISSGAGNDSLIGGGGSDILSGGSGNDTYIYTVSDGNDVINEAGGSATDTDKLVIKLNSDADSPVFEDIEFVRSGDDLVVKIDAVEIYGDSNGSVLLKNFYLNSRAENIERIEIQDQNGVIVEVFDLDKIIQKQGTSGDDVLYNLGHSGEINGGAGNDILHGVQAEHTGTGPEYFEFDETVLKDDSYGDNLNGAGGDDTLLGYDGNDLLTGGDDNDHLEGGMGDDTYRYVLGDGNDVILEEAGIGGGIDILEVITNDFTPSQTPLITAKSSNNNDLVLHIAFADNISTITIKDHWAGRPVEKLVVKDNVDGLVLGEYHLGQFSGDGNLIKTSSMNGGAGSDDLHGSNAPDFFNLRGDQYFVSEYGDVITPHAGDDYIQAGDGDDFLRGNAGHDEIHGNGGNDTIFGHEGNDRLYGGAGHDYIVGDDNWEQGTRYAYESDFIDAGAGNDLVSGADGNDEIWGREGNDILLGYKGNDIIHGNEGRDELHGWYGDDRLFGGDGNDLLLGQEGYDHLEGGKGDDWIDAGNGNDYIRPGAGKDWMHLGNGSDTVEFHAGDGGYNVFNGSNDGNDTVILNDVILADAVFERWNDALVMKWPEDDLMIKINKAFNHGSSGDWNTYGSVIDWNLVVIEKANNNKQTSLAVVVNEHASHLLSKDVITGANPDAPEDDSLSSDGGGYDKLVGGLGNDIYHYTYLQDSSIVIEDIVPGSAQHTAALQDIENNNRDKLVLNNVSTAQARISHDDEYYKIQIGADIIRIRGDNIDNGESDAAVAVDLLEFNWTDEDGSAHTETFSLDQLKDNGLLSGSHGQAMLFNGGIYINQAQAPSGFNREANGNETMRFGPGVNDWMARPDKAAFADGIHMDGDVFTGNDWNNHIRGLWDDETLIGGKGADILEGHEGGDTYIIRAGDGNDMIIDLNEDENWNTSGDDVIEFVDLTAEDANNWTFEKMNRFDHQRFVDLMINISPDQTIIVKSQFETNFNSAFETWDWGIEYLKFADGSVQSIEDFI